MLVDTHAHLNFSEYAKDIDQIIKRSLENKVTKIICVGSNLDDSEKAITLAKKYPGVIYAAVGIHPQQTDPENSQPLKEQTDRLAKLAAYQEVVAVGECGLDFSPAPPGEKDRTRKEQIFLFQQQIKIAQDLKLPLIIHTRKAFMETVQLIESFTNNPQSTTENLLQGVFHCYSAGKKRISKVTQLGFYFGTNGNLTYDPGLQNIFCQIPFDKIILETDCPFLSPVPFRNQRNEPKNIKIIAEYLSRLKNIPLKEVARQTTQNAQNLFNI
ncbi:MAG TPA: TatD family hydrolase [Candidatus Bathyarchaeia archaeon]|nr:TatD family hydrolase [Candidatus Bathyarchaeia archaeon]